MGTLPASAGARGGKHTAEMENITPAELLLRLLDACSDTEDDARRLAQSTKVESMKSFLHESAQQYRRAADDLGNALRDEVRVEPVAHRRPERRPAELDTDDVAALWERAECDALTFFRDAYDTTLPADLADTVKRHYEAGIARLERLRKLQARR